MYCVVTNACNAYRKFQRFDHHLNIVKIWHFFVFWSYYSNRNGTMDFNCCKSSFSV